jgi:hypothetical protein
MMTTTSELCSNEGDAHMNATLGILPAPRCQSQESHPLTGRCRTRAHSFTIYIFLLLFLIHLVVAALRARRARETSAWIKGAAEGGMRRMDSMATCQELRCQMAVGQGIRMVTGGLRKLTPPRKARRMRDLPSVRHLRSAASTCGLIIRKSVTAQ